jgi:tetratricopeptide (TPR) repeat protein
MPSAKPVATDPTGLLLQGRERHAARDVAGAASLYGQALATAPAHPEANHLYGLALVELGQFEVGLGFLRRSIELQPDDATMRFNLGRALLLGGQAEAAADAFAEALRLRPGFTKAALQRAGILEALGRREDAVRAYRDAVAADPGLAPARLALARLLYELDRLPEAVAEQDAAARLDPKAFDDGRIGFARTPGAAGGRDERHAAAAALCRGPGGVPAAAARELVVIDDFLADPLAYRAAALALPYSDRSAAGVNYPGVQTAPRFDAALMQRIADAAGFDIKWNWPDHGAFRLSPAWAQARSDIHIDDATGRPTFAGVLYLSLPEHCAGGTSFWRHRASGWERAPTPEALRANGFADLNAFHRTLDPPGGSAGFEALKAARTAWDLVLEVPMRFNRLILYRADHYHSISEVFGHGPADARLVQLFFFERIGG